IANALTDIRASVQKQEAMAQVHAREIERLSILVTQIGKAIQNVTYGRVERESGNADRTEFRSHERNRSSEASGCDDSGSNVGNGSHIPNGSAGESLSGQMGAGTRDDAGEPIPGFLDRRGNPPG